MMGPFGIQTQTNYPKNPCTIFPCTAMTVMASEQPSGPTTLHGNNKSTSLLNG
jgi:hypothetical protein